MDIRYTASAAAALAPAIRWQEQTALEAERAVMQLAAVTPPHASGAVDAERKRRQEVLRMSPKAACESVRDDLISARWEPQ